MTSKVGYESKPEGYYLNDRADLIEQLPKPAGRVLDVGCGGGEADRPLREAGASRIVGIELMEGPAAEAAKVFERVEVGDALPAIERLNDEEFDSILCYDVLEHLVNANDVIEALLTRAAPGGRIHVSVPNARYFTLLKDLIFHGTFGYTEYGHRDKTHVRWFTRRDIVAALEASGWQIESVTPSLRRFPAISKPLHKLTAGRSTEFLTLQWFVLARRP